jgi:endonuclease YncB( thermonuclease family)
MFHIVNKLRIFRILIHNINPILVFAVLFSAFSCNDVTKLEPDAIQSGPVTHIVDGDTYDIILAGQKIRIRMDGIDAPERGMDYYKQAKNYLGVLCENRKIRVEVTDTDKYGRSIAKSYLPDGRELGHEMVKAGMAWHYKKYSNDGVLAQLEHDAQKAGVGLWSLSNPEAPWEHRKKR